MYGVVPLLTPIAATERDRNEELWVIDQFGDIRGAWFDGKWENWYSLVDRRGGRKFQVGGNLNCLSRQADHVEVWSIDVDASLQGIWWDGHVWRDWYTLGSPTIASLPPGVPALIGGGFLAVHTRDKGHMEVWTVAADHNVYGIWFDGGWRSWYPLPGRLFPPGARLTVLGRDNRHMELWGIGDDGQLHGNWWDGNTWRGWYTVPWVPLIGGSDLGLLPGGSLASLSRDGQHMEVWSVGKDSRLYGVVWDGRKNDWRWYFVDGEQFDPGAPIVALSLGSTHMEVWAVSTQKQLRGTWWDGSSWQAFYFVDRTHTPVPRQTPLAAVTRGAGDMEVWCVAPESGQAFIPGVQSAWFNGDSWQPLYRVT